MLARRIIPCLDVDKGRVVKGTKFLNLVDAGDPVEIAKRYNVEGADEVVFLDITASSDARAILLDTVTRTAEQVFIPLTVGGGVRTVDDFRALLSAGADKISVNTAAIKRPELISEAAERFGNQCVVVAIDAKKVDRRPRTSLSGAHTASERGSPMEAFGDDAGDRWEVFTHGGRNATGLDAVAWAQEAERRGAGEILLTSMDADGTKAGYDVGLTKAVAAAVKIPVIASSGAGEMAHFEDAFRCGASAALAASLFHFRLMEIGALKKFLSKKGIPVRIQEPKRTMRRRRK